MTTTMLTLIGILLAAAAALMVSFYGGDAFNSSRTSSDAARLVVEGDQIVKAIDSYTAQEGRIPGTSTLSSAPTSQAVTDALIQKKFLSSVPRGYNANWVVDYPNKMIRVDVGAASDPNAQAICVSARKQLRLANATTVYKCDGSDSPLGVFNTKEPCCVY